MRSFAVIFVLALNIRVSICVLSSEPYLVVSHRSVCGMTMMYSIELQDDHLLFVCLFFFCCLFLFCFVFVVVVFYCYCL